MAYFNTGGGGKMLVDKSGMEVTNWFGNNLLMMTDFAYMNNSVILVYLIFSIHCIKRICKCIQQHQQMHIYKMCLSLTVRSPNVLSTVAIISRVTYKNITTPNKFVKMCK